MEMTKWFDTNYHYIVPELGPDTRFSLSGTKPFDEHAEAMEELGIDTIPVLIGPVSFLLLSKPADGAPDRFDALDLIEPLVEVYGEVIERLAEQGATWVQFDEPCFVEDRTEKELDALRLAYEELCKVHERPRIVVKTYFDHVGDAYGILRDLPIEGVGLDFTGSVHGTGARSERPRARWPSQRRVHRRPGGSRRPVALRRHRRRAERLDRPPRALARRPGGPPDPHRPARRLDQLLSASHPDRPGRRAGRRGRRPRRRDALLDGVRRPEGG